MKSLKHINKYFYRYRLRLLLGIVFVAISNFFAVYSLPYLRYAIDYIKDVYDVTHTISPSLQLFYYGAALIGMALLSGVFLFLMRQTIIVMSRLIEYDIKNEIYGHYQKLDISFYKRNNTGDLMNRISEDVSRVRMYIGPAIMYILNTIFLFILTIVQMINVNEQLTMYVLLPLPILAISIYYVSSTINKKSTKVQQQLSIITTRTQEAFSGIRILKAYGREAYSVSEFDKQSAEYKKRTLGLVRTESLFQPFMILLIGLSTIFTIYIGGLLAIDGKISYGNIAEFVVYVNRLTWPIASLGWVTSLIQRAAASQTRINEFLHTQPQIASNSSTPDVINGDIEFKNVSFTYPDSGIQALKNVSFSIKQGTSMAIIGRTGAGKSTIANLICRLYDIDTGEILIDNKNIKDHNLAFLRNQTGYAPQEVFLFSDTIAHNIAFSTDKNQQTTEAIELAAKNAAIYNNIITFPEKFETLVGERGITLSGGQKQRISIARAIIKQPQLLIFDDCLSAVDTETEEEILNNLKQIMKDKTTIIISHRVSSVKNVDNIIVLDHGCIIEQGKHKDLLEKQGAYNELYKMQLLEEEIINEQI
ncbi:MAG: ABC transporter ATP-binding protein [Bacteroidota bacterium]